MTLARRALPYALAVALPASSGLAAQPPLGVFEDHGDVGSPAKKGAVVYDAEAGTYTVTGGGENMWFDKRRVPLRVEEGRGRRRARRRRPLLRRGRERPQEGGAPHPPGARARCRLRGRRRPRRRAHVDPVPRGAGAARRAKCSRTRRARSACASRSRATTCSSPSPRRASRCARREARSRSASPGRSSSASASARTTPRRARRRCSRTWSLLAGVPAEGEASRCWRARWRRSRSPRRTAASCARPPSTSRRRTGRATGRSSSTTAAAAVPDPGHRRRAAADRHRLRDEVQQRPRPLARRHAARDQRPVAGRGQVADLRAARRPAGRRGSSRRPGPSYWHGWSPDGKTLAYCAERGGELRRLHDSRRGRRGDAADDGPGPRRRPRILARRRVDLLQLRPHRRRCRSGACTPDGSGPGAGDERRLQQLVPASLARRPVARVPVVREGREGPPAEQGRDAANDAGGRREVQVLAKLFGGQGTINVPSWSPDSRRTSRSSATGWCAEPRARSKDEARRRREAELAARAAAGPRRGGAPTIQPGEVERSVAEIAALAA